jgi:GDP-D-mannose dehydratase
LKKYKETPKIREFIELVAKNLDIDLVWKGKGIDEIGIDKKTGKITIRGTGIETDSQSVCTFEMVGEGK